MMELRRGDSQSLTLSSLYALVGEEGFRVFAEGDVIEFTLRHPITDAVVLAISSVGGGITFDIDDVGATIQIAPDDWQSIATSRAHYASPFDVQVTTLAGDVHTLVTSTLDVIPDVTR